jgi:hypothetical protein
LATEGTQDTETPQKRHWQQRVHKTQKPPQKNTTQKAEKMSNSAPTK